MTARVRRGPRRVSSLACTSISTRAGPRLHSSIRSARLASLTEVSVPSIESQPVSSITAYMAAMDCRGGEGRAGWG